MTGSVDSFTPLFQQEVADGGQSDPEDELVAGNGRDDIVVDDSACLRP